MIVSVITPFYKGNDYIGGLVANIMRNAANLKKVSENACIELIIVNDSPDINVELPDTTGDVRCRVLVHEKNSGIHQARVTGLQNCKGEYILFLDQDDSVLDNFFVKQLPYMKKCDVVIGNANMENAEMKMTPLYRTNGDLKKVLAVETYINSHNQIVSPGQCLIRKSAIPEEWCQYIMDNNGSDDLFLWILMFYKHVRFQVNKECLYTHHYTGENLSASGSKMAQSSLSFAEHLKKIDYVPNDIIDPFIRARKLSSSLRKASALEKVNVCIKNRDIILSRVIWKLRCLLSRKHGG